MTMLWRFSPQGTTHVAIIEDPIDFREARGTACYQGHSSHRDALPPLGPAKPRILPRCLNRLVITAEAYVCAVAVADL
jgi:hypothetical protein